tara:strand:- start:842 stop:1255 length:414 start_codon:yes stop_codon:yes gene_type:complete
MENTNLNSYQSVPCQKCGRLVNNVGENALKVTCSYCVLSLVGLPKESPAKTYKPTGRPAGWHFMSEYVDKDGNVFHKGKEQPKLKGTLPPTKIKPIKKKTKRRTQQQILLDRNQEKKAALKKAAKKQQDFLNHKFGD